VPSESAKPPVEEDAERSKDAEPTVEEDVEELTLAREDAENTRNAENSENVEPHVKEDVPERELAEESVREPVRRERRAVSPSAEEDAER
jgi:hypothetical protein